MTQPDAVDAFDPLTNFAAGLASAGIELACRYLSPAPNPKNVTSAEIQALHAAGIGVLLNWESDANRSLGGAANGTQDGLQAAEMAQVLGAPAGTIIFFSSDFEATQSQWTTIASYYIAASDALPPTYGCGAYGMGTLIDYLKDWGDIQSAWQTYAWSGDYISPNADLYQYLIQQPLAGVEVDFNRIIRAQNLGAWWPASAPPIDPSTQGDDEMEMIRNTGTGAVIGHLGGGVLNPVDATTYTIWNDLGRPVTQLETGPWQHYTNWIAAGDAANIAAIAAATEQAVGADTDVGRQVEADVETAVSGLTVTSTATIQGGTS